MAHVKLKIVLISTILSLMCARSLANAQNETAFRPDIERLTSGFSGETCVRLGTGLFAQFSCPEATDPPNYVYCTGNIVFQHCTNFRDGTSNADINEKFIYVVMGTSLVCGVALPCLWAWLCCLINQTKIGHLLVNTALPSPATKYPFYHGMSTDHLHVYQQYGVYNEFTPGGPKKCQRKGRVVFDDKGVAVEKDNTFYAKRLRKDAREAYVKFLEDPARLILKLKNRMAEQLSELRDGQVVMICKRNDEVIYRVGSKEASMYYGMKGVKDGDTVCTEYVLEDGKLIDNSHQKKKQKKTHNEGVLEDITLDILEDDPKDEPNNDPDEKRKVIIDEEALAEREIKIERAHYLAVEKWKKQYSSGIRKAYQRFQQQHKPEPEPAEAISGALGLGSMGGVTGIPGGFSADSGFGDFDFNQFS